MLLTPNVHMFSRKAVYGYLQVFYGFISEGLSTMY
jgi:hypothetical protein